MNTLQKQRVAELRRQGESYSKIADALGISVNTIQSFCRRNDLGRNLLTIALKENSNNFYCKQCGQELVQQPGRKTRRFCSDDCCSAWWKAHPEQLGKKAIYDFTCACCGTEFTAYGNKGRKYCSHACYITTRFGKEAAL